MPSASYHINRKAHQKLSKATLRRDHAMLIGHLQTAMSVLHRPIFGRLKWALLKK